MLLLRKVLSRLADNVPPREEEDIPSPEQEQREKREAFFAYLCRHNPVLIFSAGKAGTQSVKIALDHYHSEAVLWTEVLPAHGGRTWGNSSSGPYTEHDFSEYLMARFVRREPRFLENGGDDGSRLKIITPIREPIGMSVSAFFQAKLMRVLGNKALFGETALQQVRNRSDVIQAAKDMLDPQVCPPFPWVGHIPDLFSSEKFGIILSFMKTLSCQELRDIYLAMFPECFRINFPDYLKEKIGINIYSKPFPDNKICYFTKNNIDLVVFEYSIKNSVKEDMIKEFLGLDEFKLGNTHKTSEKDPITAQLYEKFKNEVKLPAQYIDKALSSRYFQHFYTKEEGERLRRHWTATGSSQKYPGNQHSDKTQKSR